MATFANMPPISSGLVNSSNAVARATRAPDSGSNNRLDDGARDSLTWLAAEQVHLHPADEKGRTMHLHLHINGSSLMLSDAFPEHGHALQKPAAFSLMLPVKDVVLP